MSEPGVGRRRKWGHILGCLSLACGIGFLCAVAIIFDPGSGRPGQPIVVVLGGLLLTGLVTAMGGVLLGSWRWLAVLLPWLAVAGFLLYLLSQPMTTIL